MNWNEAIEELKFQVGSKSKKTQKNYLHYAQKFAEFCNKPLDQVTTDDCQHYCDEAIAAASQNVRTSAIKFFFKHALGKNINLDIKSRGVHLVIDPITKYRVEQVIRATEHPYRAAVYLMIGCGLKTSEVQQLKIKDLHQGYVKVAGRKVAMTKKYWPYINWATQQSRGVWLFSSATSGKNILHVTNLQKKIPIKCYQLRDYFAVKLVEQGASLVELCDVLGLSALSSGVRYFEHVKRRKDRSLLTSPID